MMAEHHHHAADDLLFDDAPTTPNAGNFFPLLVSPRTRRRHRGRGVIVLDEVTASSTVTNHQGIMNVPELSSLFPLLSGSLGPTPSPDELVIQSRGRRQIPLTFSPDVYQTPTRHKQRLTSSLAADARTKAASAHSQQSRLLLPTRTSPRKRLTLSDSPPNGSPPATTATAAATSTTPAAPATLAAAAAAAAPSPDKTPSKRSPISKKCRIESQAKDSCSPPVDPRVAVKGLSPTQMASLLGRLMDAHPELHDEVRELMPAPDLQHLEDRLNYLKKNIFRALPNTRLESKTDSMAYNRVATHLLAFKKAVSDGGRQLAEANAWLPLIDYALLAWAYVRATPSWDNPPHNTVRRHCFKALAAHAMQALKKTDPDAELCREMRERFSSLKADSDEILPCLKHLDHIINNGNDAQ